MGELSCVNLGAGVPLRVAAYCRVSAEEENEDEGSFQTQMEFFRNEISEHEGWVLVGVFGDYAKTGTQIKGRTGFQYLMEQAEAGEADYIVTKSISRFSRSAADTLAYLRKLSSLHVGVYFMEQGIDSLEEYGGEFIFSVLATVAEMESRSISQNVLKTFNTMNEQGTPLQKARYGYRREGKAWAVVPGEAIRVRLAFLMTANGYSYTEICNRLNQFEALDRSGRIWSPNMVRCLLSSEVYVGDVLTNKSVRVYEEGGKRQIPNNAMVDQFYIKDHHEPLVGRALWNMVRELMRNRELAGQSNFHGTDRIKPLAEKDPMLDSVRKFLPVIPGRWMRNSTGS